MTPIQMSRICDEQNMMQQCSYMIQEFASRVALLLQEVDQVLKVLGPET